MENLVITDKKYIYLKIPTEYIGIYHKLMILLVKFGEEIIKDCKADCSARNIEVTKCFSLFNAALFARQLGKTKNEKLYISYLTAKLNQISYKECIDKIDNFTVILEDGHTGYVDCSKEPPVIYIDPQEQIEKQPSIIYGVVTPTSYKGYSNYQEFATTHITKDSIVDKQELDLKQGTYSYDYILSESKQLFVVLVPSKLFASIKIDDGFGNKVEFGSTNTWFSNGNTTVIIDNVEYKIYGELYPISANIKFYVNVV